MAEPIATVGYLAGLCGHDGTNWLKVKTDANGYLYVVGTGTTGAMEVTQDTPGDLLVGSHQYDGSAWRKSNLLWGYNDTIGQALSNTNLSVGTNLLDSTAVPEGEVWVVNLVAIMYVGTSPTNIQVAVDTYGVGIACLFQLLPTSARWYMISGNFVIDEGQKITGRVDGATAGDDLYFRYIGYKMKIDM